MTERHAWQHNSCPVGKTKGKSTAAREGQQSDLAYIALATEHYCLSRRLLFSFLGSMHSQVGSIMAIDRRRDN
jgi:hypothetical protein